MIDRRNLLLGTAGSLLALPATATEQSAHDFVAAIYATYKGKDSKGIILDNARTIRRYFEPSLAALMIKDQNAAARRSEVGALDGDPFIDAQDWEIKNFNIAVVNTAPGKASATVKFTNFGKSAAIVLDLVRIKADWRIRDITWRRGGKDDRLSALFR